MALRLSHCTTALFFALTACSGSSDNNEIADSLPASNDAGVKNDADASNPSSFDETTDASSKPANLPSDCAAGTSDVFVVSHESDLYRFNPGKLEFTKIGALNCPVAGKVNPSSMAVDRQGTAWVYAGGPRQIFKVSTTDASCTATSFSLPAPISIYGMGFSTNGANDSSETLYADTLEHVAGGGIVRAIRSISLSDMTVKSVLPYTPPASRAELTGTGDGKLFAFFNDIKPAQMSELNKSNGSLTSTVTLNEVPAGGGFAFSFWGGDFWFYTSPEVGHGKVSRYKASGDKSTSVVLPNIGFTIVGAGVSTCAPLVAPVN